jgi:hypothetical protein
MNHSCVRSPSYNSITIVDLAAYLPVNPEENSQVAGQLLEVS